jgi:hypothetical protein
MECVQVHSINAMKTTVGAAKTPVRMKLASMWLKDNGIKNYR